jgi:tetratricopeptide (TPR) repeat protein
LRLAVSRGALGIELDAPFRLGPLRVTELAVSYSSVRFPVDLSGGVARFRHRRGELLRLAIAARTADLVAWAAPKLTGLLGAGRPEVVIAPIEDGALVGVHWGEQALAFEIVVAETAVGLCLIPTAARGLGLGAPAHVLSLRVLSLLLRSMGALVSGAFVLRDAAALVARELCASAGARAPSSADVRWGKLEGGAGEFALAATRGAPVTALGDRALSALELCELAGEADALAFAGDFDEARRGYLAAQERAPRHPELSRRVAAIDATQGDRAEGALGALVDAMFVVDAGLLGGELLRAVGDSDGARTAFSRAAEAEAFGPLASLAWLRAAELATELDDKIMALDRAVTRAPSLPSARWARLAARLELADLRGAKADADHLEAMTRGSEARLEVWRRAAELFLARGYVAEASSLFERALRYAPDDPEAVTGLARSLRESGDGRRALDLFARAVALAEHKGLPAHEASIELARGLAELAGDRPAAIARVRAVPADAPCGLEARRLEGRWRAELGDLAGAALAFGRLRAAVELEVQSGQPDDRARAIAAMVVEAGVIEERDRDDVLAAQRSLGLALRLLPRDRAIAQAFRRVSAEVERRRTVRRAPMVEEDPRDRIEPVEPSPSRAQALPIDFGDATDPPVGGEEDEALVQRLTDRLRADPSDHASVMALADALTRLGRDMDLLALLSARIEEGDAAVRSDLLPRRRDVLERLAENARREGRPSEAELYEMMVNGTS